MTTCNLLLCKQLIQCIRQSPQHRISFADYMECVLHHPQYGYYAAHRPKIGPQGDFFTAPHLGPDFGQLLATQFAELWEVLGQPQPFTLVELGAGQGLLAADVLTALQDNWPDLFARLHYIIIEQSAILIAEQRQRLQRFAVPGCAPYLRWLSLDEIPSASIIGCCFSNELVDAFPVHQIAITNGQLQEIYVTVLDDGPAQNSTPTQNNVPTQNSITIQAGSGFIETLDDPSTPEIAEYFNLVGIDFPADAYPDGYRNEVNLAALNWIAQVADRLQRGYLLTIDYGYSAERYYSPARHQGTLQCYYQHRFHDNPYLYIGYQDITAHVNFTALDLYGERCGLARIGFIPQGLFLMALGLGDRIAALSATEETLGGPAIQDRLRRREALHALIDPQGMGNFGVLFQGKGLTAAEKRYPLKGLNVPQRA